MAHCGIIPQPLRHTGLVRLIVLSGFTSATEVKAAEIKFATYRLADVKDIFGLQFKEFAVLRSCTVFSNLDIGFLFSFAVMESNMVREYAEEVVITKKYADWIVALSYVLFLSTIKTGFKNIKITKRIALSAGFFCCFFQCVGCL